MTLFPQKEVFKKLSYDCCVGGVDNISHYLGENAAFHRKLSAPEMLFLRDIMFRLTNCMATRRLLEVYPLMYKGMIKTYLGICLHDLILLVYSFAIRKVHFKHLYAFLVLQ